MRPFTFVESRDLPDADSASMSGLESINLIMLEPAPHAEEISGTKANTFPACVAPNVVLYQFVKKSNMNHSHNETHHQTNEERRYTKLFARHEGGTIPENKRDDVEGHGL
jgi:hypothetical protein